LAVLISGVLPQSIAGSVGLRAGDLLTHIGDEPIHDVLDYRFFMTDSHLTLRFTRGGDALSVQIEKDEYADLGLEFESYLMDGQKQCKNHCIFCFIDQNPTGMRESVYFKDDDDRLSFLLGNYITLTNLTDADVERIIRMRLSPVNVSVHATDPAIRSKLMRNPAAGKALDKLKRLADGRIPMNVQLVLCPGINDGEILRKSLCDLEKLFPAVQSIACVPVGLTGYREGLVPLRPFTKEEAENVLDTVQNFSDCWCEKLKLHIVFAADEFFLKAERPFPPIDEYGDFLQLENGVGMSALFVHEFMQTLKQCTMQNRTRSISLATGEAAFPLMTKLCKLAEQEDPSLHVRVFKVENRFFGGYITVAGLLTGSDLESQLTGQSLGQCLLLPSCMLRADKDLFLDNMTPESLGEILGVSVLIIQSSGEALANTLMEGRFF
jgi:putative radical SAM enzyme (TIGR03279 family)